MTRAKAPSHTRSTPFKKTKIQGVASACHKAAKTKVATQAPIIPRHPHSGRSLSNRKKVQAHAATNDPLRQAKNRFIVASTTAWMMLPLANVEVNWRSGDRCGHPVCRRASTQSPQVNPSITPRVHGLRNGTDGFRPNRQGDPLPRSGLSSDRIRLCRHPDSGAIPPLNHRPGSRLLGFPARGPPLVFQRWLKSHSKCWSFCCC